MNRNAPRPEPRLSEHRVGEYRLWLLLSAAWAVAGGLAFVAMLWAPRPVPGDGGGLTLLAVLVASIGFLLRRRPLSACSGDDVRFEDDLAARHLNWLLATVGTCNSFGALLLASPTALEALPAALIVLAAEIAQQQRWYRQGGLPWLPSRHWELSLWQWLEDDASPPQSPEGHNLQLARFAADDEAGNPAQDDLEHGLPANQEDSAEGELANVERNVEDGIDETGRRYLTGAVRVRLAEGQLSETVIVGFFPKFEGQPEVDLECDGEEAEARLVHATPQGMRVSVRREGPRACGLWLRWFAVQSDSPPPASPPRLP